MMASAAALALMVGGLTAAPASAVPSVTLKQIGTTVKPVKTPYVEQVRDRGHRGHWRHRHHRHRGDNWGPWVAGGLLGLGLYGLSQNYDDGYDGYAYYNGNDYAYDNEPSAGGYARCEATFRSFDPSSGTYVGYDGVRRMCPYL
jgi:hypothetical protein